MMLSKHASTRETTNFARLAWIILGPCADVLRDILKNEIHPLILSNYVKKKKNQLTNSGDISGLDISLLYNLLRNKCTIPPHTSQWGNDPSPGDRSVSANIERIRFIRNKYYGHAINYSLSDDEFDKRWKELHQIVKELESHLGTSRSHQDAITILRMCSMDSELEKKYIEELVNRNAILESLENIQGNVNLFKLFLDCCRKTLVKITKF